MAPDSATGRRSKIEITPEMIEAGSDALWQSDFDPLMSPGDASIAAEIVLRGVFGELRETPPAPLSEF